MGPIWLQTRSGPNGSSFGGPIEWDGIDFQLASLGHFPAAQLSSRLSSGHCVWEQLHVGHFAALGTTWLVIETIEAQFFRLFGANNCCLLAQKQFGQTVAPNSCPKQSSESLNEHSHWPLVFGTADSLSHTFPTNSHKAPKLTKRRLSPAPKLWLGGLLLPFGSLLLPFGLHSLPFAFFRPRSRLKRLLLPLL